MGMFADVRSHSYLLLKTGVRQMAWVVEHKAKFHLFINCNYNIVTVLKDEQDTKKSRYSVLCNNSHKQSISACLKEEMCVYPVSTHESHDAEGTAWVQPWTLDFLLLRQETLSETNWIYYTVFRSVTDVQLLQPSGMNIFLAVNTDHIHSVFLFSIL